MMKRIIQVLVGSVLFVALLSGCFGQQETVEEPIAIRSPYPTFTPTPLAPATPTVPAAADAAAADTAAADTAADPSAAPAQEQPLQPPASEPAAGDASQPVLAVVSDDLINIRRGPGLEFPPIKLGMRGDQFTVIGRSADDAWWQVCCVEELPAWISQEYIDTDGPVDNVPVADPNAPLEPIQQEAAAPAPTATPAPPPAAAPEAPAAAPVQEAVTESAPPEEPTAAPAPAFPFALASQEQFPESNNLVRVFLYVFEGEQALPGYTLRVTHDGAGVPVNGTSSDAAGMTWPTASPRQRFQNLKVEFPGVNPAGVWEIQLVDGGGAAVGPAATFTLDSTSTDRELYVRYEKQ